MAPAPLRRCAGQELKGRKYESRHWRRGVIEAAG